MPLVPSGPLPALEVCSPCLQACLFMVYLAIVAIFASSLEVIPWMVTGACAPAASAGCACSTMACLLLDTLDLPANLAVIQVASGL